MSQASQKRRLARRWVARRDAVTPNPLAPAHGPSVACGRCSTKDQPVYLGGGQLGREVTYWTGVASKRKEVTRRVCDACVLDVRRAGPGGSIGMHGNAQHMRIKLAAPWLAPKPIDWDNKHEAAAGAVRTRAKWAAWLQTHACIGQGPLDGDPPAIQPWIEPRHNGTAPFVSAHILTCAHCGDTMP